ncbi:hypothetical protein JCM11641_003086 [Rhodosporidiobolus odoratus]
MQRQLRSGPASNRDAVFVRRDSGVAEQHAPSTADKRGKKWGRVPPQLVLTTSGLQGGKENPSAQASRSLGKERASLLPMAPPPQSARSLLPSPIHNRIHSAPTPSMPPLSASPTRQQPNCLPVPPSVQLMAYSPDLDSPPTFSPSWLSLPPAASSPTRLPFPQRNDGAKAPSPLAHVDLPSPTPPATPPSPSYPFPRMPETPLQTFAAIPSCSPPRPARPSLTSAFTTCTTIRLGGKESYGSDSTMSGSAEPIEGDADGEVDLVGRVPSGIAVPITPVKATSPSLPPTPPATSPRRRPPHLSLHSFSSASFLTVVPLDQDIDQRTPVSAPAPTVRFADHGKLEETVPSAIPLEPVGAQSFVALNEYRGADEFPWRWSESYGGRTGLASSPSLPSIGPLAATDEGRAAEPALQLDLHRRRRTVADGEIGRVQKTLADAAVVFAKRDASPKAKREGVYVPLGARKSMLGSGINQVDKRSSVISNAPSLSSTSSLARLPYVSADDSRFEVERLSSSSALRMTHAAYIRPPPSTPSRPSQPGGIRALKLAPEASPTPARPSQRGSWWPLSNGRSITTQTQTQTQTPPRVPLIRQRSSSAPSPRRQVQWRAPLRNCFSPASSGSRWSVSSSSSSSSSLSLNAADDLPPSSSVSALFASTAPSTSSLPPVPPLLASAFPSRSPAPMPRSQPGRGELSEQSMMVGEVAVLKGELKAEQARTAALEDEVGRLKRVVAVLIGLPMED